MRARRAAGALLLAGAVAGLGAGPAQAQGQQYRYWSFWDGKGASWAYATEGPGTARPADGAVVGFRFAVSVDSAKAATPRTAPDFAALCDRTPARAGSKRVGVVVDFGTAADAPSGERPPAERSGCARVPADAPAGEALAAVAKPLRYDASALLCAIAGYPRSGCAEQVAGDGGTGSAGPPAKPGAGGKGGEDDGGGPSAGLIGGIGAVVVLGAAGVWQARRRRG
ncbi:SCO2322 family protein [Streptomyces sp. WZ-12]|uniref:SCO2322 family protein n=1 Tax=Streptomyces sp. WZ-12 TaxID=3030210 RepID=UPI0023816F65|nr:SCO2322 family protein [Streptomyces sp. WZ-12]